jgi:hypothetical protein
MINEILLFQHRNIETEVLSVTRYDKLFILYLFYAIKIIFMVTLNLRFYEKGPFFRRNVVSV